MRDQAAHAALREPRSLEQGIKQNNAHGGCLGIRRRRRARQAAKVREEAQKAIDPRDPEWENPPGAIRVSAG